MQLIRRLILSLALIAGITPAIAQVPAPVPALPDAERRTAYTISGTTCACAVNFALYGDSTDFNNWVEVFLNGVRVNFNDATYGWTITSPSGSLATLPRPISNAVLTFNSAQTGTVQIVGARRPRRTSQFGENAGVSARNLNQAFTDIIAQNRELWDKTNDVTGRAALAPPGETLALLPVLASRRNMGACFDSGGNLTSCVSVPSTTIAAGNGILFTGTNPTTIANNIVAGTGIAITGTNPLTIAAVGATVNSYITSPPYNAKCDGATDDTAAIQAAINAQPAARGLIGIPPNSNCVWAGVLDFKGHNNLTLAGVGNGYSSNGQTSSRMTYTGGNVVRAMDFRDTGNNTIIGLSIINTTAAMTGYLIDAGATVPGTTIQTGFTLKDSSMFGGTAGGTASGCLNISETQLPTIDHVWFQRCQPAIHGQNILGQNTTVRIQNSTFTLHTGAAISECGEGWTLLNNTWEPDVNGRANGFANSLAAPCKGIEFINPWMGDVTVAGGTWISLTAQGGTVSGGRITVGGGAAGSVAIGLNGGTGYNLTGTIYEGFNLAIGCVSSPTAGRINANTFIGVASSVQAGCVNFNRENNSPDISPANGVPTITSGNCGAGTNGTISGTNASGVITVGAAATTTCTVNFSTTLPTAPNACSITPGNATAAATGTTVARVGTPSTTSWVITGAALASTVYSYSCAVAA